MKMSLPIVLAAGAAVYFLFLAKKNPAPAMSAERDGPPGTLKQCLESNDAATCARFGFKAAGDILDLVTSELKGIDGCCPPTLAGHMSSLGAYNGLGGTFYGDF